MKMPIMAVLACGIALGAVLTVAADSGSTPDKSELAALRQQVQALEARVAALEKLLQERRQDGDVWIDPLSPRERGIPRNWVPREFNGRRYYVIPLQQDPNRPVRLRN